MDGGGRLGVSDSGKGGTNGESLLAVEEGGSNFGFYSGRHNFAHDVGYGMDGAVEGRTDVGSTGRVRGAVAQEVVPVGAAPCLWIRNIGGVNLDTEDHVTGWIADGRSNMGGDVVE